MPSLLTRIELDVDALVEHIRELLHKNPDAEIHINAPKDTTLRVGGPHPDSATPSGGHHKP